jgi:hypothetical protein
MQKFIRAINLQTRFKNQDRLQRFTYGNGRFQRGRRIIVSKEKFATPFSVDCGPSHSTEKFTILRIE